MEIQILCIGLLLLSAFFFGKLTNKLKLGTVIGQILGGMLVGPYFLNFFIKIPKTYYLSFKTFHFFSFLYLSLIAFSIGEEFHFNKIKKNGFVPIFIVLFQALLTFIIIFSAFYFFKFNIYTAIILSTIGIATSPAAIFILLNEINLQDRLSDLIAGVVVLADIIEIILFSLAVQLYLQFNGSNNIVLSKVFFPVIKEIGYSIILAIIIYIFLRLFINKNQIIKEEQSENKALDFFQNIFRQNPTPSTDILLIIIGFLSVGVGICFHFNLPFLLVSVLAGVLIANFHNPIIFHSLKINNIIKIFNLFFFAILGSKIRLDVINLNYLKYIILYIVCRTMGKYLGTYLGAFLIKEDRMITKCLPKIMLPQAGVAAVEVMYVSIILGEEGKLILNIILPSIIIFEIFGLLISEHTLKKWKNWVLDMEKILLSKKKKQTSKINFKNYFNSSNIFINLDAKDKPHVFELILNIMSEKGIIVNSNIFIKEFLQREKLHSTGFGNGIAIPHIRTELIDKPILIFAKLNTKINFNSIDKKPVDLIFLMLTPINDNEIHLKILSKLSFLLSNQKNLEELRKSTSINEILDSLYLC